MAPGAQKLSSVQACNMLEPVEPNDNTNDMASQPSVKALPTGEPAPVAYATRRKNPHEGELSGSHKGKTVIKRSGRKLKGKVDTSASIKDRNEQQPGTPNVNVALGLRLSLTL